MNLRALEEATARFYDWELLGRGWHSYPYRVKLEPTFRRFEGYRSIPTTIIDDARKPSFLSSLIARLRGLSKGSTQQAPMHTRDLDWNLIQEEMERWKKAQWAIDIMFTRMKMKKLSKPNPPEVAAA